MLIQRMDAPLNTGQTLVAQHKPVDTSKKTSNAQLQEKSRTTESSDKNKHKYRNSQQRFN